MAYYWPKMEDDVEAYVIACFVNKTRLKEAGLLQPMPVPEKS